MLIFYFSIEQGGSSHSQTMLGLGESIISLLLKLHSQLSGVPDSYCPDSQISNEPEPEPMSTNSEEPPKESRIGDGPYFISQLLRKISNLDPMCKESINETRNKLWPRMQEYEDEQRAREHREKEEKKRRAKQRQQQVMADFANKQKQFMEKAMEIDETETSGTESDGIPTKLISKKEYDCVICNQTTHSCEEKPMGLVVLVQVGFLIHLNDFKSF